MKRASRDRTGKDQEAPVIPAVTHTIELAPHDWAWATWRPRPAQIPQPPAVAAPAFKLKPAVNRLARLLVNERSGEWLWGVFKFKPPIAKEAAHFWLTALTAPHEGTTPEVLARQLEKQTFDGHMTVATLAERLATAGKLWSDASCLVWQMLRVVLSPVEIMELLLDERVPEGPSSHFVAFRSERFRWLQEEGGRLTQEEVDRLKPLARARLALKQWPEQTHTEPPLIFHIAARLGLHDELLALVNSWPDDYPSSRPRSYHNPQYIVLGLGDPRLVESHMRRLKLPLDEPDHVRAWLAHTELSALDYVRDCILAQVSDWYINRLVPVYCLVKAPEVAPHLLALRLAGKGASVVRQWFDEQVGNAVAGLIPVVAERGQLADAALEYLRDVKRKGHTALIEEQVRQAPPEAADRVRRLVLERVEKVYTPMSDSSPPDWLRTADEVTLIPPKGAKLPAWASPNRLLPVTIGENCLSDAQVHQFLLALKASALGQPLPLLGAVKEHADPASLEAFAWRLFDLWQEEHAPPSHRWVVTVLGHLGGEATALKLTPLIRAWGAGSRRQQAIQGAECLCAIGTDTAIIGLNGLAEKSKPPSLQRHARVLIEELVRVSGLSKDQLDDRIVPDLGLDERGTRVFDFGPRKFRVILGGDLKPVVQDESGKGRADLPKPNARDDAEKAAAALAEWKLMKKQLREAARAQAARLERALVNSRRWSVKEFETFLVRKPLMFNLVRRLLWGAFDDKGDRKAVFRVTEEREYLDKKDTAVSLKEIASVGLVHPLFLEAAEQAAWGELFADYEISQPFPQLGRAVYRLEPGEAEAKEFTRFVGKKVAAVWLMSLDSAGWVRDSPGYGISSEHRREFPGPRVTAVLDYEPGIPTGDPRQAPDQVLGRCFFPGGYTVLLGQVDPVVLSEVLKDLTTLASKGT